MDKRFLAALGAYGVLIAFSIALLRGLFLKGVLILMAGLIAKTFIGTKINR